MVHDLNFVGMVGGTQQQGWSGPNQSLRPSEPPSCWLPPPSIQLNLPGSQPYPSVHGRCTTCNHY
eukprot:4064218-Prorocentrum_lima.AAC.1